MAKQAKTKQIIFRVTEEQYTLFKLMALKSCATVTDYIIGLVIKDLYNKKEEKKPWESQNHGQSQKKA